MKRRLLIPLITAAAALGSGVASANATYWAQNGLLLEVSADPRDGSDFVQTNAVTAGSLELVALNDNVRLRGMTVRFSDGRTFSQQMRTIRAGEHVRVDLPENCGVIQNVQLDYGPQIVDRTPARLQIIPHQDRLVSHPDRDQRRWSRFDERSRFSTQPTYSYQPSTYQTTPTYVVPAPRTTTGWSGYIQGSFSF